MAIKNNTGVLQAPTTGGTHEPNQKIANLELVNVYESTTGNGTEIPKSVGVDSGNLIPREPQVFHVDPITTTTIATGATGATGGTGTTGVTGSVDYTVVASSEPTSPSWETDATEIARLQLVEDSATAEQSQLKSRQNVETNANKANNEFTLLTYQQNQNIEKMGWGGGSYHDAKMQEAYLQASIQADMYGQLELQKYGYETEMAKARAAFDANQKQLALEYMKEEYNKAYNTAQMTGVWIDPTVKDRLAQWDIATKTMKEYEGVPESDEYKKAKVIKETILGTFNFEEGTVISEQGVDVLRQILEQQSLYSTRTLTAAQIEDMEVETDNAKELVENERVKADEAKGIYAYTDTNGNQIKVDIFNGSPEEIKALITSMPSLKFVAMGSFTDKLNAEYESWRTQPGNESKTMADFKKDMKGTFDTYKAEAENWARKAGLSSYLFNGKTYQISGESGESGGVDTPPDVVDEDTIDGLNEDPNKVSEFTFPLGDSAPESAEILKSYGDFYQNGYGVTKTGSDLAVEYANDVNLWNKITSGENVETSYQQITDLVIKFQRLSGEDSPKNVLSKLIEARYGLPSESITMKEEWSPYYNDNEGGFGDPLRRANILKVDMKKLNDEQYSKIKAALALGSPDMNKNGDSFSIYKSAGEKVPNQYKAGSGWNVKDYDETIELSDAFLYLFGN